ncbi:MAG: hypothetical protein MJE77_46205 [Proteobacteria bacterium]|nr:hypothetical protein [Pseudomonadota bacterium]
MLHYTRYFALFFALLAVMAGCEPEVEELEADVSRVCLHGIELPFTGQTNGQSDQAVNSQYDLGDLDLDTDELAGATVMLDSMALSAGLGIDDFAFVDRIEVDLAAASQMPPARLAAFDQVGTTNPVRASGDPATDLSPYLQATGTEVEVAVFGDVPATPWTVLLDACLNVER